MKKKLQKISKKIMGYRLFLKSLVLRYLKKTRPSTLTIAFSSG
jgi:hypothetical protein